MRRCENTSPTGQKITTISLLDLAASNDNGNFSLTYTTACAKNSLKSRTRRPPGAPV
jgi:hypothetical protein